jgi:hypothetical protein
VTNSEDGEFTTYFQIYVDSDGRATSAAFRGDPDIDPESTNQILPLHDRMPDFLKIGIEGHNRQAITERLGGNFDPNGWKLSPGSMPFAEVEETLRSMGFTPFLDLHPSHFGGNDFEGIFNGTWYRVTAGRPLVNPGGEGPTESFAPLAPASFLQVHSEEHYYRPSGQHRKDWIKNQVRQIAPFGRMLW